ncbi:MAG: glycerol acyltransferase [Gammaproteobacteria bacterium RBG_16_57_12]|nr:MAG: glycerol acyltransferase [Gammaproteobacteria bacterium RBG_16_57_12]
MFSLSVSSTAWVIIGVIIILAAALWTWRRFLRRCEAECEVDWGSVWLNRFDGLNRLFCRRFHRLRYEPLQLPHHGGAVVVANHVSGLDPLLLMAASRRPLRFLIAREQYRRRWLTWLFAAGGCIPVDREERPERAFREALEALRRGEVIALFPHGTIHLDSDPPRRIKSGAIRLAVLSGSPIFPLRLEGIRGQGHTILSVIMRSRARIHSFPPIECDKAALARCADHISDILEGRAKITHATLSS